MRHWAFYLSKCPLQHLKMISLVINSTYYGYEIHNKLKNLFIILLKGITLAILKKYVPYVDFYVWVRSECKKKT